MRSFHDILDSKREQALTTRKTAFDAAAARLKVNGNELAFVDAIFNADNRKTNSDNASAREAAAEAIKAFAIGADKARRTGFYPYHPENTRRIVLVYVWSRDCDMCESDSVRAIPATLRAFNALLDDELSNREGPVSVYPISYDEALKFSPTIRDRVLEAYENGQTYNV